MITGTFLKSGRNDVRLLVEIKLCTTEKSDDIISRISDIEDNLLMLRKGLGPSFDQTSLTVDFSIPSTATTTTFSHTSKIPESTFTTTILEKIVEIEEKLKKVPPKNIKNRYSKRPKFTRQQVQNFRKKIGIIRKSKTETPTTARAPTTTILWYSKKLKHNS